MGLQPARMSDKDSLISGITVLLFKNRDHRMQFMDCFDCRKTTSNTATLCPCAPTSRPQGSGIDTSDGRNGECETDIFAVFTA
jgi:hypothetical protein